MSHFASTEGVRGILGDVHEVHPLRDGAVVVDAEVELLVALALAGLEGLPAVAERRPEPRVLGVAGFGKVTGRRE